MGSEKERKQELEKRHKEQQERINKQRTAEAERDKIARARAWERVKPSESEQKEEVGWDAKANISRVKERFWDGLWDLRRAKFNALQRRYGKR